MKTLCSRCNGVGAIFNQKTQDSEDCTLCDGTPFCPETAPVQTIMSRGPLLASAHTIVSVVVEYTNRGARVVKTFTGTKAISASRAFYKSKMVAGADPKVVGASRNHP